MRAWLFILLLNLFLPGSLLFGQVSVQILDPVLGPGESTMVAVEVSDASADCSIHIYGVNTEALVNFRDTVVRIPGGWPNELPFVVTLPVQALPNVAAVWGQYLIVAELSGTGVPPEIIALSPGQPCSGSVGVGQASAMMTFEWEATGQFAQFEVVLCENPCGKEPWPTPTPGTPTPSPTPTPTPTTPTPTPTPTPPSPPPTPTPTPTTPTPTPTPSPQPSGPITPGPVTPSPDPSQPIPADPVPVDTDPGGWDDDTDEPLPPLPPGWAWGPEGPYWTGERPPEPPALPPGWEWGPLYPGWTGIGQPTSARIITTGGIIPASEAQNSRSNVYSHTINISEILEPGEAFVYQIYGIAEGANGETTGVLSTTMCERFSPLNQETGVPADATPCPTEPICDIATRVLVDPAMAGGLKREFRVSNLRIKRDDFLPLGAEGRDYDKFEWECKPSDDCPDTGGKKTIPLTGRVKYQWRIIQGEGNFVQLGCLPNINPDVGEHVIFEPPYVPVPENANTPERKETTVELSIIDDNRTQPKDDTVKCRILVTTERRKGDFSEDFYYMTVRADNYTLPTPPETETEEGTCEAGGPVWENPEDLRTPSEQKPAVQDNDKMVVGQWMRLLAVDQRDNDHVKVSCTSEDCDDAKDEKDFEDNVQWNWEIITGGNAGKFVTGPAPASRNKKITARYVIYEAPDKIDDDKPYLDVDIEIEVFNPEGLQIVDTKPPKYKFTLRIYKAGIELQRTPADWLPEKENTVDLTSTLKYYDGQGWQDALAHMCRIHFFELNNVTKEKGYCTNAPAENVANKCFDLRLKNENAHEAFTKSGKPGKPTSSECREYRTYLVEARTKTPEKQYTITVHCEDYGAFGTLLSHGNINIYNPARQKNERPVYTSIPVDVNDHPARRSKKTVYEDDRVTIPRDIDENHISDRGWRATPGNGAQADPDDVTVDTDSQPAGDGYNSDGYTAYEEYRGFDVVAPDAGHVRTDLDKKNLMVWNEGGFNIGRYRTASGSTVHEVAEANLYLSRRIYWSNFNSPTFRSYAQAGLKLRDGGTHSSLLGIANTTTQKPAPPNWVRNVTVYATRVRNKDLVQNGFLTYDDKSQQVVAHELGHAVNIYHHGEGTGSGDNINYDVEHGPRSGDLLCIMRYDNKDVKRCQGLAETEVTVDGRTRRARVEPTGTIFCSSSNGTGYNAGDACFGNCAAGRGNCIAQFRISGRDSGYPTR